MALLVIVVEDGMIVDVSWYGDGHRYRKLSEDVVGTMHGVCSIYTRSGIIK